MQREAPCTVFCDYIRWFSVLDRTDDTNEYKDTLLFQVLSVKLYLYSIVVKRFIPINRSIISNDCFLMDLLTLYRFNNRQFELPSKVNDPKILLCFLRAFKSFPPSNS